MEGNFVADARIDDSDEVLQLPIVKRNLKKLLGHAVKKIALLGAPVIPSSEDTLELFLTAAGKFFGKDPSKWEPFGEPKIEVTESEGKRYIKNTGTFTGTELHLFVDQPYYDERLPVREDRPELNFNEKRIEVTTNEEWQEIIGDQPWSMSIRRQVLMVYLNAKLEADDGVLAAEGCHGFWEMSINKENHADIRVDRLAALLTKLNSTNIEVATLAAAAVWGLATTGPCRRNLADLDVVALLVNNLKRTLKMVTVPDDMEALPEGAITEMQRALLQRNLLGALAVLLIDRCCRRPYLQLEPDFATLFTLCKNLEGYSDEDAQARRETAAKVLTSLVQRDGDARRSLIISGSLRSVLGLLNPQGPGENMIQFCMASLLATMVLDDDAMDVIRERGEGPVLFESCIVLLTSTLDKLHAELSRQLEGYYQTDDEPPLYDLALGVRLAEAASQAMWGSAHICVMMSPVQVKMEHVHELGKMGMDCITTDQLPLSRVCHCVTATLATLASVQETADLIMDCPENAAIQTLLTLVEVFETENFERAGHVKAAACAGLAFLSCHIIGAQGDECMSGPYRLKLLEMGAFGALLRAALTSVMDEECDMIVQQAAAIALMYLSTMAGSLDPVELAMYAALLMDSDNSEMIEFLMAGMWILLRNPENRKVLGSSFTPNPNSNVAKGMMNKLNDAITLHEVNDQAHAAAAMVREQATRTQADTHGRLMPALETIDDTEEPSDQQQQAVQGEASAQGSQQGDQEDMQQEPSAQPDAHMGDGEDVQPGSPTGSQGAGSAKGSEEAGEASPAPAAEASGRDVANPEGATSSSSIVNPYSRQESLTAGGQPRQSSSMVGASSAKNGRLGTGVPAALADDESLMTPPKSPMDATGMDVKKQAKAAAADAKGGLDSRFDKQLKDNWGLETLVSVGESWLPAMLEQDQMGEATDVPVLKLFEFLVASICLFMIEDEPDLERRELDLFRFTAPPNVQNRTWWTVDAKAPEPPPIVDMQMERALSILVQIVGMRLRAAWKSIQLGVLTLWNACARNGSMERHVVEKGVCVKLIEIMNNPGWPASLRDIAGGLLEFFCERYSNLAHYPKLGLPTDVDWPYPNPPDVGVVPTIAAHITLINSRMPLLEYRGCHGIARLCYTSPYSTPNPKEFVRDAKAVSAVLGAVDAIIALIKRVNKRYQDILSGVKPNGRSETRAPINRTTSVAAAAAAANAAALNPDEEDHTQFEKDMTTLEATQDVYFVLFAALLNISVLRSVQPMVAKKGLLVLLGTNTLLYGRVSGAAAGGTSNTATFASEEKLLHLCSSIIQNISLHPQNRTRLYKAELKGTTALDKLIEDAMGIDDEEIKQTANLLPPIHQFERNKAPSPNAMSPKGNNSPSRRTTMGPTTNSRVATSKANQKTKRFSPNGAVLNASIDTALAAELRPKVIFPPIVERKEEVWPGQGSANASPANTGRRTGNGLGASGQLPGASGDGTGRGTDSGRKVSSSGAPDFGGTGYSMEPVADSKDRFLNWLDNTFQAGEDGGASSSSPQFASDTRDGSKRTARKQMWDENGDWLETEPETSKVLNRMLCRPLNQMWKEAPEARARHGQARWEPIVSEYREATPQAPLTRSAARLLTTQPPRQQDSLMVAATQMMTTGKFDEAAADEYAPKRPGTADRHNGRVGLTVLKPNPEVVLQAQMAAAAQIEAEQQNGGMSLDDTNRSKVTALPPAPAVPLKICLGPQRPRQVMTFEDRVMVNDDPTRPVLTIFEKVEGSRVCDGLFPSYHLPNGRQTYMYYSGGTLLDEVHVDAVVPPPRPSTVPEALQQSMPLADVLALIAKPPGSAPPFIPYKPVPYLVPLPGRHTVAVKRPDLRIASAFGDLREDNLQLVIMANKIIKTQVSTRVEAIIIKPVEDRDPWTLPMSIFKPRAKECDSRGYHDNRSCEEKMFERDWARACGKEKFTSMLAREHKNNKNAAGVDDKEMLKQVHDVLLEFYHQWYGAFVYFAGLGSGDPYHMSLNQYTTFLDECQIADPESQFIKRSDCDTIFIVCNFQPDKKSAEAQVNLENAMMRYEFLECLVRCALAKYGRGQSTEDVAEAVRLLLQQNISANLPPGARLIPNDFRNDRLYNEEVDLVFKRHAVLLKAIYSRYRLKPPGGGLRTKMMKLEGWSQMLSDTQLYDGQFTMQDGALAFLWSRMFVTDEIKDFQRYTSLTFIDFLEGLGRVADMKSLPLDSDLDAHGYANVLEWAIEKERVEGNQEKEQQEGEAERHDIFRTRDSAGFAAPKNRPLYVKVEMLLDLIFRRLFYDPSSPDIPFSYDGVLKLVKKIDKDLGP